LISNESASAFIFLYFMCYIWDYLVSFRMDFWKPYLQTYAEAIRVKCRRFNIFGFVDNTMNDTCRPGVGPSRDCVYVRNLGLLQRNLP